MNSEAATPSLRSQLEIYIFQIDGLRSPNPVSIRPGNSSEIDQMILLERVNLSTKKRRVLRTVVWLMSLGAAFLLLASCSNPNAEREGEDERAERDGIAHVEDAAAEVPIGKKIDWQADVDNPRKDGWDSEVRAAEAKAQLKKFGKILGSANAPDHEAFAEIMVAQISSSVLRPKLDRVFEDRMTAVHRLEESGAGIPAIGIRSGEGHRLSFRV